MGAMNLPPPNRKEYIFRLIPQQKLVKLPIRLPEKPCFVGKAQKKSNREKLVGSSGKLCYNSFAYIPSRYIYICSCL